MGSSEGPALAEATGVPNSPRLLGSLPNSLHSAALKAFPSTTPPPAFPSEIHAFWKLGSISRARVKHWALLQEVPFAAPPPAPPRLSLIHI